MAKSQDVILVHGAWADGSSWAKVIPLLVARGHSVTAVQLPLTSLGDDVARLSGLSRLCRVQSSWQATPMAAPSSPRQELTRRSRRSSTSRPSPQTQANRQ